jgi:hypothetical protein
MPSAKTIVVEYLGQKYLNGDFADGIVKSDDITAAIDETDAALSKTNPANFLKDIIRKTSANQNWPDLLKDRGVTARQRYGERRVMQFIPYAQGQTVPFPDEYEPTDDTIIHPIQTASLPYLARQLGRSEETWLAQIAVNLRLVETQLSLFSAEARRANLRDVAHLQTGVKTQPEIDATFVASFTSPEPAAQSTENMFITCEVKQRNERVLIDQIREQIAKAFEITRQLQEPRIDFVKAFAMKVVPVEPGRPRGEYGVYVVEFQSIPRAAFEQDVREEDPEALYRIPMTVSSSVLYTLRPRVKALG